MRRRAVGAQRGVTIIELLVALAVFALFILMVDAVFYGANRSSRKAELAADVQQNARIAVERLTREVRESGFDSPSEIRVGGSAGHGAVVFRSSRLPANISVFCLYARSTSDPTHIYNADCFTFPGGNLTGPPYAGQPASPLGTYTPIWQRTIGYYVVDTPDGLHELRRVVTQLNTADAALPDPTTLSGGDVIATFVETFDVSLSGTQFIVTLKAKGTEMVQGRALPEQELLLPAQVLIRN